MCNPILVPVILPPFLLPGLQECAMISWMHWDRVDCAVAVLAVELGGYSLRIGLLLFCGECEMIDKLHGTRIAKCSGLG